MVEGAYEVRARTNLGGDRKKERLRLRGLGTVKSKLEFGCSFQVIQIGQGTEMKGRFKMKKLMCALAAVAAGVAFAGDATVASPNIVG